MSVSRRNRSAHLRQAHDNQQRAALEAPHARIRIRRDERPRLDDASACKSRAARHARTLSPVEPRHPPAVVPSGLPEGVRRQESPRLPSARGPEQGGVAVQAAQGRLQIHAGHIRAVGGGPGAGPVGIVDALSPYRPVPTIERNGDLYRRNYDLPKTIGKLRAFFGNFGVLLRAYSYIRTLGPEGLKHATEVAVLNANYIMHELKGIYDLPYDRLCKHECVFSDKNQARHNVHALEIAKRLIDYGFHPPTMYFPLIVKGAMMIEPTETESKETLDHFIEAMKAIAQEAEESPELLHQAPHITRVSKPDETQAARHPVLRWRPDRP